MQTVALEYDAAGDVIGLKTFRFDELSPESMAVAYGEICSDTDEIGARFEKIIEDFAEFAFDQGVSIDCYEVPNGRGGSRLAPAVSWSLSDTEADTIGDVAFEYTTFVDEVPDHAAFVGVIKDNLQSELNYVGTYEYAREYCRMYDVVFTSDGMPFDPNY